MFDIDKYLDEMEIKDMNLSDEISARIKKRCEEEQRRARRERESGKRLKKAILIAVPLAAVLLIGVFLGAWLFSTNTFDAVAYYTVDVNPSIRVHVDADGNVKSVVSQNDDAQAIVDKLQVKGKNVTDAIGEILAAVKDAGYFDAGQKYVLIGCFTADGTQVQSTLTDLQAKLEADFGDMIDLLIVSGSLEDLQEAYQLKVSAGLLKLSQLADGVEVTQDEKIEDVVVRCFDEENYFAPELSASVEDKINLSWDEMDFAAMGYAGKVQYSIVAGNTEEQAKSEEAAVVKTMSFYTYAEQPRSCSVTLDPGVTKYFALKAQYGETVKRSNVVMATMPGEAEVTPSPSPEPTETDKPEPTETPLVEHTVTGKISGDKVILNWSKETAENFQGYKVVASKTNPNPKYPEDGYIKYITNRETTSVTLYQGFEGLTDSYYYFSVTYLFEGSPAIAANAVYLKVPPKAEEPTDEYPSSTIYGSISDAGVIVLEWSNIDRDDLDGYKVMYSFTDSTPVYGDSDGCSYLAYVEKGGVRRFSFNANELGHPGATCYFSITALYNDHTIKRAGNAKALKMPGTAPTEHSASNISGSANGTSVSLSWDKIEDPAFSGYKVMYSFTDETPVYGEGGCYYYDYITNASTTSCSFNASGLTGYNLNSRCWFSITVIYNDGVQKAGNVKMLPVHPYVTSINGSQDGNTVNLSWAAITGDPTFMERWFLGYQVWYQFDGRDAVNYTGEGGTRDTSISINMSSLTDSPTSMNCKFWIKTHYDGGVYKPSGNKTFTYTPPVVTPTPTPPPEPEHFATTIRGEMGGTTVYLNWNAITGDDWFMQYRVMYQFEGSGPYCKAEITDSGVTSKSLDITSLNGYAPGVTCSFWIVVRYDGGPVDKAGNKISFTYTPPVG